MNHKFSPMSLAVKLALSAGAVSALGLGSVGTAVAQEEATQLDRIQVTGSRIRSVDAETSQPVLQIDRAEIQAQGLTSVADVLRRVSAGGAVLNTTFNNGGNGSSNADLRGLGAQRTLVLVNGRRWVSALNGTVDLNTIPSAIIERVEILKDGASSIYGSDAIAGVINIITRDSYEGAEINYYIGQFEQGDGDRETIDITFGVNGDRGNLVVGLSHTKEDEVFAGARRISADPQFGTAPGGFSGLSDRGRIWNAGPTQGASIILPQNATPSAGGRFALDQFQPFVPADAYNFAPDNYLLTPQRRTAIYAQGRQEVTQNVSIVFDALYNERRSAQELAGFPLNGGLSNDFTLSGESFFNPFNTLYGGDGRDVVWSNRLTENPRNFSQDVKTFHVYTGLEGFFEIGSRYFSWDAGYAYNKTDRNDIGTGNANLLNVGAGVGPSFLDPDTGNVVCGTPGAPIAGCIPFNPLVPAGQIPQNQLDAILFTEQSTFQNISESFTANITGDIVQLPAGMMGFAAGYERRKESGFDQPDAFVAAGLTSGNARQATSGAFELDEFYGELLIPILADVPFAELLEVTLATRYSDYSNFGDTTNSKFGLKWKPIESLLVRANWAEGFRAPSLTNLFQGASDTFSQFGDPCSVDFPGYNPTIAARCAADGVPADYLQFTNQGFGYFGQTQFPFTIGGNPNVGPESSESRTLGFVWSPNFVENLDISLDYWLIELEQAIGTPAPTTILNNCYVEGITAFCGSENFIRRGDGVVTNVFLGPRNISELNVEGYDFNVRYQLPETSFGLFSVNWDSSYQTKNESRSDPNDEFINDVGRAFQGAPYWRLRSNANLDWTFGDFGATWTTRYYSSLQEACALTGANAQRLCSEPDRRIATGAAPRNKLGATTYHDLQVRHNLPWNATVRVGANNLFAKEPPVSYQAFANSFDPQYDVPGRFYYLSYNQRF